MSEERRKFSGRDLAEALAAAREHFGLARQQIAYEVTSRPKIGIVGGPSPAVEIEAWPASPSEVRPILERPERPERFERGGRGGRDRGGRGGGGRGGPREDRPRRERGFDRDRGFDERADEAPPERRPIMPAPEVTEAQEILRHVAGAIIAGLDLQLTVDGIDENEIGLRVKLEGEDVPLLLESEAEGLEALQYVANRALQKDGRVDKRVSFDAGGFRAREEARWIEQARTIADEVRQTGRGRKMPPMGPYERRIVHMALNGVEGIRTFSTGSGYHRRLHIAPAGSTDPTDPEEDS
ncbi:MAG: hypothetical protein KBD01_11055 [Acidobacteria bacterium]|nr:hypothetical protein [Acidobacteriota bacterium]